MEVICGYIEVYMYTPGCTRNSACSQTLWIRVLRGWWFRARGSSIQAQVDCGRRAILDRDNWGHYTAYKGFGTFAKSP